MFSPGEISSLDPSISVFHLVVKILLYLQDSFALNALIFDTDLQQGMCSMYIMCICSISRSRSLALVILPSKTMQVRSDTGFAGSLSLSWLISGPDAPPIAEDAV